MGSGGKGVCQSLCEDQKEDAKLQSGAKGKEKGNGKSNEVLRRHQHDIIAKRSYPGAIGVDVVDSAWQE